MLQTSRERALFQKNASYALSRQMRQGYYVTRPLRPVCHGHHRVPEVMGEGLPREPICGLCSDSHKLPQKGEEKTIREEQRKLKGKALEFILKNQAAPAAEDLEGQGKESKLLARALGIHSLTVQKEMTFIERSSKHIQISTNNRKKIIKTESTDIKTKEEKNILQINLKT